MSKFRVTYTSGLVEEVDQTDASNLAEFLNVKFGLSAEEVAAAGVTVEDLDAPPAPSPKAEKASTPVDPPVDTTQVGTQPSV